MNVCNLWTSLLMWHLYTSNQRERREQSLWYIYVCILFLYALLWCFISQILRPQRGFLTLCCYNVLHLVKYSTLQIASICVLYIEGIIGKSLLVFAFQSPDVCHMPHAPHTHNPISFIKHNTITITARSIVCITKSGFKHLMYRLYVCVVNGMVW